VVQQQNPPHLEEEVDEPSSPAGLPCPGTAVRETVWIDAVASVVVHSALIEAG
jgi:hypothetical protein